MKRDIFNQKGVIVIQLSDFPPKKLKNILLKRGQIDRDQITALQLGTILAHIPEEVTRSKNLNFQQSSEWKEPKLSKSIQIPLEGD